MGRLYYIRLKCNICEKIHQLYYQINIVSLTERRGECCNAQRFDEDAELVQENVDWCVLILEEE